MDDEILHFMRHVVPWFGPHLARHLRVRTNVAVKFLDHAIVNDEGGFWDLELGPRDSLAAFERLSFRELAHHGYIRIKKHYIPDHHVDKLDVFKSVLALTLINECWKQHWILDFADCTETFHFFGEWIEMNKSHICRAFEKNWKREQRSQLSIRRHLKKFVEAGRLR